MIVGFFGAQCGKGPKNRALFDVVRKKGLEPSRPCGRQPLKLVDLLCWREWTRVLRTNVWQERAAAHARDDIIRTHSHTGTAAQHDKTNPLSLATAHGRMSGSEGQPLEPR